MLGMQSQRKMLTRHDQVLFEHIFRVHVLVRHYVSAALMIRSDVRTMFVGFEPRQQRADRVWRIRMLYCEIQQSAQHAPGTSYCLTPCPAAKRNSPLGSVVYSTAAELRQQDLPTASSTLMIYACLLQ